MVTTKDYLRNGSINFCKVNYQALIITTGRVSPTAGRVITGMVHRTIGRLCVAVEYGRILRQGMHLDASISNADASKSNALPVPSLGFQPNFNTDVGKADIYLLAFL